MEKAHQFVSHQLIKELAHILNETSLCIKLHFTTQPKLVSEFGVHFFLHSNYQQQIIHAKFNLKVYYPPLYKRELWHYKKTNTDKIKQTIVKFFQDSEFANLNVNEMAYVPYILSHFIPHHIYLWCWKSSMNQQGIEKCISRKKKLFKFYVSSKNNSYLFVKFQLLQEQLDIQIEYSRLIYSSAPKATGFQF